ncbi:MAG: hypothetical protein KJ072_07565 [Verrucomicrobia bacterium]|nr:hypothetical protein [Verrucomicrobiota bacterium]
MFQSGETGLGCSAHDVMIPDFINSLKPANTSGLLIIGVLAEVSWRLALRTTA